MRAAWDSYAGKWSFSVGQVVAVFRGLISLRGFRGLISLMGVIGLMGLMSCSKEHDEEIVELGEAICFSVQESEPETVTRADVGLKKAVTRADAGLEKAMTRADQGLETKAQAFVVWGYKNDTYEAETYTSWQLVMPGYTVNWMANTAGTTSTNSNNWDYILPLYPGQTIKYWDWSAKAYRFFGYALPSADPSAEVIPTGGTPYDSPSVDRVSLTANVDCTTDAGLAKAPYFSELWFSDGNPSHYPDRPFGKPVTLRFKLPFARVRFLFTFNDNLSITRANLDHISFHPSDNSKVPTKGNITVSYPIKGSANPKPEETWNSSVTDGVRSLNIDWYETSVTPLDPNDLTYPNQPEHWHYVLPIVSQGSYTMEVSVEGRQVQTAVVPANYMTWKPGYEYTYVFKITHTGEVTFNVVQVAINQWDTTGKSADHPVYNW